MELRGIIAPVLTPFAPDDQVDWGALERVVEYAIEEQRKFSLFPSRWIHHGLAPVMKAAMKIVGVDAGDPPPALRATPA